MNMLLRRSNIPWVDSIPSDWDEAYLRRYARLYTGGTPSKAVESYWENGTIPWLNSGSVNSELITEPSAYITEEAFNNSSAKWIPKGSLVMALAGQGKTKGMVAQLDFDSTCNQSMAAILPNEKLEARFLYYWLKSNYQNIRNMGGGDLRDGLNLEMIASIKLPLPSRNIQREIIYFLDGESARISTLIAEKQNFVSLLKEKRQALITHVVTKGLDPNVPMKDSGVEWLGEVPAHWERLPIKHTASGKDTLFLDGDWIESKDISGDEVRYITTGNVGIGRYKEQGSGYITESKFKELNCTEVFNGDILISRLNLPIGRACIVPNINSRIVTSVDNVIYRPNSAYNRNYLVYLFSSEPYFKHTSDLARGATMQRVSRSLLGNIRVVLPPFEEQLAIVKYLDRKTTHIDAIIAETNKSIELLKEKRSSLVTAAVTGKIDIKNYHSEIRDNKEAV